MDTKTQKLAERLAALPPEDLARLERLDALAVGEELRVTRWIRQARLRLGSGN